MYTIIISVQGGSDILDELENIFAENHDEAIDYLAQWDYGTESEYNLVEQVENFLRHDYYAKGEYILEAFPAMEWYTLYRLVK